MHERTPLIAAWARSAVVPRGGAFAQLLMHDMATPVLHHMLAQAGVPAHAVDTIILGNALGAGGNPARMLALHAGLHPSCSALTVDTQCCAGLDAVRMGAALIASGQAHVVVAGGAEAWSRSPIRLHRPTQAGQTPVAFDRPAFAPTPEQDPDMLVSAARYASQHHISRAQQEAYALLSHQRAVQHATHLANEIVPIAGVTHDTYPRLLDAARAARMPAALHDDGLNADCALTTLTISAQADGAALVLLLSPEACTRLNVTAKAKWVGGVSVGGAPESPLVAAELAARHVLHQTGLALATDIHSVELHDAFAVQGLSFCSAMGLAPERINPRGGGLARGHPIGASGAIALVRVLSNLARDAQTGAKGLVAVAGAGGLGAAAVVAQC
jgi:acetyl-CoA C-acetyltransferase